MQVLETKQKEVQDGKEEEKVTETRDMNTGKEGS